MKNLLKISLVLLAVLLVATTVNAATVNELIKHVTTPQTINGEKVVLVNNSQKAEIERYLTKNDVSEEDMSYIIKKYDEAVEILKEEKTADYSELSNEAKNSILSIANEVSTETGIEFTVNSNGTVTVYNLDGTVFDTVSPIVKQTGSSNYAYIPVIAIIAVAIAFGLKRGLVSEK